MSFLLTVYLLGVGIGLWKVDGSPMTKVTLALLWPIGPIAGVLVVTGLLLVSLIAFPTFGAVVALAAALTWWLLG